MNEWIIADLQHSYGLNCAAIVPDTAYMVMEFCSGKEENTDTITIDQMRSLRDALRLPGIWKYHGGSGRSVFLQKKQK